MSLHHKYSSAGLIEISLFNSDEFESRMEGYYMNKPALVNLSVILNPFLKSRCLVHLTSFRKSNDLHISQISAVMLRHVSIYHFKGIWGDNDGDKVLKSLIWLPPQIMLRNFTTANFSPCPLSSLFEAGQLTPEYMIICSRLKRSHFSLNAKQWNCEVSIGILPPSFSIQKIPVQLGGLMRTYDMSYPATWYFDKGVSFSIPSCASRFHVLVIDKERHLSFMAHSNGYNEWVKFYLERHTYHQLMHTSSNVITDGFLVATTTQKPIQLGLAVILVDNIWPIRVCLNCLDKSFMRSALVVLGKAIGNWNDLRVSTLTSLLQNSVNDQVFWHVHPANSEGFGDEQDFREAFDACENSQKLFLRQTSIVKFARLAISYAWLGIMKNYSYPTYFRFDVDFRQSRHRCTNHGKVPVYGEVSSEIHLSIQGRLHIGIPDSKFFSISNNMDTIKFVSCGRSRLSSLAFHELTNVFDMCIWVFITLSILGLSICGQKPSRISDLHATLLNALAYSGNLLEQGTQDTTRLKFPFGLFLLGGIVLSNAYKNSNVYNMVKPRAALPYEYFDQLVQDRFQIYTRNLRLYHYFRAFYYGDANESAINRSAHEVDLREALLSHTNLESEIAISAGLIKIENDQDAFANLKENSKLHPDIIKVFLKTAKDHSKWHGSLNKPKNPPPSLLENEQEILEQSLNKCDKVALLLPQYICKLMAGNMSNSVDTFVGKESLLKSFIEFDLSGYIPPRILVRVKQIQLAGLWARWEKLVAARLSLSEPKKSAEPNHVKKPTMAGNTLVIFIVLLVGCAISTTAFSVEIVYKIIIKKLNAVGNYINLILHRHSWLTRKPYVRLQFFE